MMTQEQLNKVAALANDIVRNAHLSYAEKYDRLCALALRFGLLEETYIDLLDANC